MEAEELKNKQRIREAEDREAQCVVEHARLAAAAEAAAAAVDTDQAKEGSRRKRFWYDKKEKHWLIGRERGENLSVESLEGYWIFKKDDCLTFRWRKPNRWGSEDVTWLEFFLYVTPGVNILFKVLRGCWPCAVCHKKRSEHIFWTPLEASLAVHEAYQDRDIDMCVRLVKGGADCTPGGQTWGLVVFIMANYCKDPFKEVMAQWPDANLSAPHLHEPTPEINKGWYTSIPFL